MKLEIYNTLRERIIYLEYEPGSILNEQNLANEFKVSRTTLRAALFRLEWEHLIKILPRTGIQVTELELNRIINVYQARLEIEDAIGRIAAKRFTQAHTERLTQLLTTCDPLLNNKNAKALTAIDFEIKDIFYEAVGNPYLKETAQRWYALTFRLWYFNLMKMDDDNWNKEVLSVKDELTALSAVLSEKHPIQVGQTRKAHLRNHLERIRTTFFSLSDDF
ncbi:MAG: hypothetical protein CSA29_03880 [Desulfobacterales bacterium]|nr:MAG: hypothetical protein CSA29_03880 [Desulfobacterales bacterium]